MVEGARLTLIFTSYADPIEVVEAVGLGFPDHSRYGVVGRTMCGKHQHPSGLGPAGGRQVGLVRGPERPAERSLPYSERFAGNGVGVKLGGRGRAGPWLPGSEHRNAHTCQCERFQRPLVESVAVHQASISHLEVSSMCGGIREILSSAQTDIAQDRSLPPQRRKRSVKPRRRKWWGLKASG